MNKVKILLVLLFSITSLLSNAQSTINVKLLESKIKLGVDSVRRTKKLASLINDSILYLASIDHGKYLESKKELTHYQNENEEKKTPQDRAEYYGAKNYLTGENIVLLSIDGSSEQQIAEDMVKAWVNSPGHYANMINGDYDITGIAVDVDLKNKRIIAVQTFAAVSDFYAPSENKTLFPYAPPLSLDAKMKFAKNAPKKHSKHAYGITERNKTKVCKECDLNIFTHENISMAGCNDSVYLKIRKGALQKIKNHFENDKDGIAFEFVIFDYTYSCDPANNVIIPTRRNGACEFDGPITPPLYKDAVLAEIQRIEDYYAKHKIRLDKNETIDLNLGRFPDRVRGQRFEVNLLVFKKNRLCQVVPSVGSCGASMINPLPRIPYTHKLTPVTYVPLVKPWVKNIKVYFEKNKSAATSDTVINAVNEIKNSHQKIVIAKIKAFASVEGSLENNEKLFIKRAESVLKQFEAHQDSIIPYQIETKENWELFRKQLKDSKYKYLLEYDSLKLRAFVNDTANAKMLEPLFAQQRYAIMTLYIKPKITSDNIVHFALEHYRSILKKKEFTADQINKMTQIQQFLFNEVKNGRLSRDSVRLDFPRKNPNFSSMIFNEIMFDYLYNNDSIGDYELYQQLSELNKLNPSDEAVSYNAYAALFNSQIYQDINDEQKNTAEFTKILEARKIGKDTIQEFKVHENHLIINKYFYHIGGRLKPTENSLQFIKAHYNPKLDSASDAFKYELALYYVFSQQFSWAMELLKPLALKENFNHEVFITYLKVYQSMSIESPEYSDLILQLVAAHEKLTQKEWCDLFIGFCNINFQTFDDATLRNLYCESCVNK